MAFRVSVLVAVVTFAGFVGGQVTSPPAQQNAGAADAKPAPALDEANPLGDLTQRMGAIATDLEKLNTGDDVRQRQHQVVSDLDELIARLRHRRT